MMALRDFKITLLSCLGMFITVLNFGNVNVVLPHLQGVFQTSASTISWIVSIYVLSLSCTILLFGKLSDRYGKIKLYQWGFLIFLVASILCALSSDITMLIFSRFFQGLGAAVIQANAVALITSMLPEEKRIKALSYLGLAMGVGPVLGPALGGIIVSCVSWRWIFILNIPVCLWGYWSCSSIKENLTDKKLAKLPYTQLILFSLAIITFLLAVNKLATQVMLAIILMLSAFVFIYLYLKVEKNSESHIFPPGLFYQARFSIPLLGIMNFGFCSAFIFILPPFYFANNIKFSNWQIGLIGLLCPLGFTLGSQLISYTNRYISIEKISSVGLLIMLTSLVGLFSGQIYSCNILFYIMLFIYGFGGAIFQITALNIIMKHQDVTLHGTVGAVVRMCQNITVAIGATISGVLIQHFTSQTLTLGFSLAWVIGCSAMLFNTLFQLYYFHKIRDFIG